MLSQLMSLGYGLKGAYLKVVRPLTLGVRAFAEDGEGRILLVRHTYRPGWYLPGGGVDKGESLEAAILRELWEEVGLRTQDRPQLFHAYSNFREYRSDHVVLFRIGPHELVPNPNVEIAEFGYFAPDDLPPETTQATRNRIAEMRGLSVPGPIW